jgi:subtilisin family serine protease
LKRKNKKCKLPPFKLTPVLSVQEAAQKAGWGITTFNIPKLWEKTQGEGVKVAVLDTGVQASHHDLNINVLPGINLIERNKEPYDVNAHGTHCAGVIAAQNNEIGIVGVAPKCQIIPVKILDDKGSGRMDIVAKGIRWAVDNGADLISMSLGCPFPVQEVRKAIQYAVNYKVPVFCAAGNAGNKTPLYYPAAYPETISVGAADSSLTLADFSNVDKGLDFIAPGVEILSTVPDNWYAVMNGTSMATPWLVGIAALILSHNRKTNSLKLNNVDDYRSILKKYTIPVKKSGTVFPGFGIVEPIQLFEWMDSNHLDRLGDHACISKH